MTMADRIAILDDGELQQLGEPQEVFNWPVNTFVAQFIGSPNINLLSADLERDGDEFTVIHNGSQVQINADDLVATETSSQPVTLGCRPQDLFEPDDPDEYGITFTGEVTLIEPLGTDAIVRINTEYGPIRAMTTNYQSLDRGDLLTLAVEPEALYLFDNKDRLVKGREIRATTQSEVRA